MVKQETILDEAVVGQQNVNAFPVPYTLIESFHKEGQVFVMQHHKTHPYSVARGMREVLKDDYWRLDHVGHHIENELIRDE